ncbi:MAG: porphobilinogen synthase [Thermoplasmatales archaeon]|nr:porphobilinogen synthase [Thermoplasmatales archaeon]MCW6171031.1 porphobilinogen synthase [Thermoplasmatales archaeon]
MPIYPEMRMRRLRRTENLRGIFSENVVRRESLIMPMFFDETIGDKEEISTMPGIYHYSLDSGIEKAKEYERTGISSVLLFGIPKIKDSTGSQSYATDGIVQRAILELKKKTSLNVFADLCMCEYTDHGHCGILSGDYVDNDKTLVEYRKIAHSYADAGVDVVAPSGMMDGQVKAIREELDQSGFKNTIIMGYSAKFASSMYAPFREAAHSAPSFGDRRSYQMNFANSREAMREIEEDISEGADIIMVKPAMFYLDLVREARNTFSLPLAVYNVSGEYSMIMNAAKYELIDRKSVVKELLTSFKRSGADLIISYFSEYAIKEGIAR